MWKGDEYFYGVGTLRAIAENYDHIYEGMQFQPRTYETKGKSILVDSSVLIEYKSDFDKALNAIGRGNWTGNIDCEFKDFRRFDRLQRIVIADIYDIQELELEALGFYRIPQIRGYAYHLLADRLNGEPHHGTKTQFVAKPLDTLIDNRVRG